MKIKSGPIFFVTGVMLVLTCVIFLTHLFMLQPQIPSYKSNSEIVIRINYTEGKESPTNYYYVDNTPEGGGIRTYTEERDSLQTQGKGSYLSPTTFINYTADSPGKIQSLKYNRNNNTVSSNQIPANSTVYYINNIPSE